METEVAMHPIEQKYFAAELRFRQVTDVKNGVSAEIYKIARQSNAALDMSTLDEQAQKLALLRAKQDILADVYRAAKLELDTRKRAWEQFLSDKSEQELVEIRKLSTRINNLTYQLGFLDVRLDKPRTAAIKAEIEQLQRQLASDGGQWRVVLAQAGKS